MALHFSGQVKTKSTLYSLSKNAFVSTMIVCVCVCLCLTLPMPGFSLAFELALSRHGGAGGEDSWRMLLKLVG